MEKNGVMPDGPVRLIPIYTGDIAVAMRISEIRQSPDRFRFRTDMLAEVFDILLYGVLHPDPDADTDWMCNAWVDTIEAQPTLVIPDTKPDSDIRLS